MANLIQFWLSQGNEWLRLPVNPSSISYSDGYNYNDVEVVGLGEITIPGERQLSEVSFSSFFPNEYNPTYCEYVNFPRPLDVVEMIKRWQDTRRPIRLVITGTPINMSATLRNPSYDYERAGESGDIYYNFTFKEFVEI